MLVPGHPGPPGATQVGVMRLPPAVLSRWAVGWPPGMVAGVAVGWPPAVLSRWAVGWSPAWSPVWRWWRSSAGPSAAVAEVAAGTWPWSAPA